MAERLNATMEMLPAVPLEVRGRIVSGIRWTLWLSLLAVPFSYGTSFLLARTSPEAIGTYGLLMVYVSLVSCFFYLGGDAVAMKFLPELEAHNRRAFLISYFLVVCVFLVPWLGVALWWPPGLRHLFGERGGAPFQALILCLSPIYILFSMVVASLKGMLEVRWAQTLMRLLTIGSFLLYATLFFGSRALLVTHYTELIWGTYLGLAALAGAIGLRRLLGMNEWQSDGRALRFFLPRGFWRYALSLQQLSVLSFFINELHYLLVLNFGGLPVLGKYVAILTLATTIRMANSLFLDTLLSSLTNLLARRNPQAASQVLSMHFRLLFLANTAATCALMLLAGSFARWLGPEYAGLRPLMVLMVLLVGLSSPGVVGGVLLTSVGKQHRALCVGLGQLALFGYLFLSLWPRWQLWGAVCAYGISLLVSHTLLLVIARHSVAIDFSAAGDYARFALVVAAVGSLAMGPLPMGLGGALLAWAGAVGLFLVLARYRLAECLGLMRCFAPGWFAWLESRMPE